MSSNDLPAAAGGGRDLEALRRGVETLLEQEPAGPERTATEGRLQAMLAQMVADGARREDPIREVMARLGDKWSPLLLLLLAKGSFRHATLRRLVSLVSTEGRISQRMLTLRLRSLERDGLVSREIIATHPPGVRYALTPLGYGLVEQYESLMEWTRRHSTAIRGARAAFASAPRPAHASEE
ncbi:MAG: helix-turn-helix domain-containing protein [Steroidobacteraceae bacterium]